MSCDLGISLRFYCAVSARAHGGCWPSDKQAHSQCILPTLCGGAWVLRIWINSRNLSRVHIVFHKTLHTYPVDCRPASALWLDSSTEAHCGTQCRGWVAVTQGHFLMPGIGGYWSVLSTGVPMKSCLWTPSSLHRWHMCATPGWNLKMAITRVSWTVSLGALMVLGPFFLGSTVK